MHHFCTYFDHRFLTRGLALYHSLRRHATSFTLHALCLDDIAYRELNDLHLPGLHPIALSELEKACPALLQAKTNRSLVEYYFTCTPVLPLYVLDHIPGVATVSYVDADLYFFTDPTPLFNELGTGSVLIIEHRYPPQLEHFQKHGIYNVGLLTFRNDERGRECLTWWRDRCLEWCYDRLEDDRFADQKYLNDWPTRFPGVVVCQNKGANLAPWNLGSVQVHRRNGIIFADNDALIFYHFHHLKLLRSWLYEPGLDHYLVRPNTAVIRGIYAPYLRELQRLTHRYQHYAGNLRINTAKTTRQLLRTLIYDHSIFSLGPVTTIVHFEPWLRWPLAWRERRGSLAADSDTSQGQL